MKIAGKELNFDAGKPLTAGAHSNRLLWSAATMDCDLYLGQPMSVLVGDKLYESEKQLDKTHFVIDELKATVEFPDIRQLVNNRQIGIDEILRIRNKAQRFRNWLQDESGRDRDALIAYHHEVAKEAGYTQVGRKTLNLFGAIGGPVIGAVVGTQLPGGPPIGAGIGAGIGGIVGYVPSLASKLGANWKPVVFGNWYKSRIKNVLDRNE